ncbi:hypothetical protein VC273_17420 [Xanthomonas nasturtii]|uniref:hypothetical protein n=1 Tax=Xanthomonas TaxID=338 RepID=UPI002B22E583|nr:hypothetical protein [Xanthomonas nasturtii]MEA9557611.1 hypothetical protein [Xanthomonas nasturtii]
MEATAPPLAIIIDDAYALPAADDVLHHWTTLLDFLKENEDAMSWFLSTFEVESVLPRKYSDQLASNEALRNRLWESRFNCPVAGYEDAVAGMLSGCSPKREILEQIELALGQFSVKRFSRIPKVSDLPPGISVVVLDYILSEDASDDSAQLIEESIAFVQELTDLGTKAGRCPLMILVSNLPTLRTKAKDFKDRLDGLHGAFFRFVEKNPQSTLTNVKHATSNFESERDELNAFRRYHIDFKESLKAAVAALQNSINELELQDLAALQVGQLSVEHESLGDYMAWLCGQSLAGKLHESSSVATSAAELPEKSYKILLGHLEPSKGIPELFTEVSMVRPASSEIYRHKVGKRALRFGDVFRTNDDPPIYYLVASQTCDLLHGKLPNGQVLCIQGEAAFFETDEASLLDATFKQMTEGWSTLKVGGRFMQIEWISKSLKTISQADLEADGNVNYVGRLNEIYALEAQQKAAQELTRIGVPIKPNFGYFFESVEITAWSQGNQIAALSSNLGGGTIEAVLRPEKGGKNLLLMSNNLKQTVSETLMQWRDSQAIQGDQTKVKSVTELVAKLRADLDSESFRLVCRPKKGGGVTVTLGSAAEVNQNPDLSMIEVVLKDIPMYGISVNSPATCVRMEFKKI